MIRVIPRDLFNDGNLLTNYGKLYIELEKIGLEDQITGDGEHYQIEQCTGSGCTWVSNVVVSQLDGTSIELSRAVNSRRTFCLEYCVDMHEMEVFEEDGTLTSHFVDYIKGNELRCSNCRTFMEPLVPGKVTACGYCWQNHDDQGNAV